MLEDTLIRSNNFKLTQIYADLMLLLMEANGCLELQEKHFEEFNEFDILTEIILV